MLELNHFPDQWKVSRISPIPKIKNPQVPSDYRPISILHILSKVYERLIMFQIMSYLESHKVLSEHQSGFRKGHCTVTACLKIRDDILKSMDRGEVTLSIMADYSKAFDTVDYETLTEKQHQVGFSKNAKLLHAATSTTVLNLCRSIQTRQLAFQSPQGSVLGQILFNIRT